jgi:hypothetical protein
VSQEIEIGHGFTIRFYTEKNAVELMGRTTTGLIITGPAPAQCKYKKVFSAEEQTGLCGGGVNFTNSRIAAKEGRPMWQVKSWEPLTLTPSIVCGCGGQHGFITNGQYVPCG